MIKNNIIRFLERKNIKFEVFELPKSKLSAEETAGMLNVPISVVYKTIILKTEKSTKSIAALIPADRTVDLKKIAKT